MNSQKKSFSSAIWLAAIMLITVQSVHASTNIPNPLDEKSVMAPIAPASAVLVVAPIVNKLVLSTPASSVSPANTSSIPSIPSTMTTTTTKIPTPLILTKTTNQSPIQPEIHANEVKPDNQKAPQNTSTSSLYRQLDDLRSQNAILAEALKNAELKNKLNTMGNSPVTVPGISSGLSMGNFGGTSSAESSALIQMVSGSGTNLTALISLPNGGRVSAKVGSNIPGLGTVSSISLNEVLITNKKQISSIPFANEPGHTGAR